jgi:hypothetical protein
VGRVFLGHWKGENVAIKACNTSSVAFNEAEFRYELALMSAVTHDNLLPCLAADVTGSTNFMLLPFQGIHIPTHSLTVYRALCCDLTPWWR